MEQNVIEILETQFDKLPESLQAFIVSGNFKESIKNIRVSLNLDDKKQTVIENETLMVLLGLESLSDLEKNLKDNAGLTQERALNVVKEIAEKMISPVETDLREFLEEELREELQEENVGKESRQETTINSGEVTTKIEERGVSTEEMKKLLRENSKSVNIKNLIANLK